MRPLNQKMFEELLEIERTGELTPARVVAAAEDPKSELHKRFDWDDGEAARNWRLSQARQVIRVAVTVLPSASGNQRTRLFVSLGSDRKVNGQTIYRPIMSVLSQEERYSELLEDALLELEAFKRKYRVLTELSGVLSAIDAAFNQHAERLDRRIKVRQSQRAPAVCARGWRSSAARTTSRSPSGSRASGSSTRRRSRS